MEANEANEPNEDEEPRKPRNPGRQGNQGDQGCQEADEAKGADLNKRPALDDLAFLASFVHRRRWLPSFLGFLRCFLKASKMPLNVL